MNLGFRENLIRWVGSLSFSGQDDVVMRAYADSKGNPEDESWKSIWDWIVYPTVQWVSNKQKDMNCEDMLRQ